VRLCLLQRAADAEDEELEREQRELLERITVATHGATTRLQADWESRREKIQDAVQGQWEATLRKLSDSRLTTEDLHSVTENARALARRTAGIMADAAAVAFEEHVAPFARASDEELERLADAAFDIESARSRVRANLTMLAHESSFERVARGVHAALETAEETMSHQVESSDPLRGGSEPAFVVSAEAQLDAIRTETLRLWRSLGEIGEEAMLQASVAVASSASAFQPRVGDPKELSRFIEEASLIEERSTGSTVLMTTKTTIE
jgi:hypothetical protein